MLDCPNVGPGYLYPEEVRGREGAEGARRRRGRVRGREGGVKGAKGRGMGACEGWGGGGWGGLVRVQKWGCGAVEMGEGRRGEGWGREAR